MVEASVPAVLRERASLQPDDTAFTFVDYDHDWNGVEESLTWSQLYRRALNVARALKDCGSTGDRAVILAPQGLDYIVAFLGALEAGLIAVPLSVPLGGVSDERVSSVLRDASPTVVLTTSDVVGLVADCVKSQSGESAATLIEVDLLDLDAPAGSGTRRRNLPDTAYLQYTSGSTRLPAGVMITHRNLVANFEQIMSDYFVEFGGVAPPDMTIVSWLPFYHDMGLVLGVCAPVLGGFHTVLTSPVSFLQRPARWVQLLAKNSHVFSAAPNFAFELAARKTSDEDMAGLDLGDVLAILSGSERVHPATLRRFNARFGHTFEEPQALFSTTPKILGLDGQAKMSKSLGNTISLREDEKAIWDKLRTAATDPARVKRTDPGTPEKCNVYTLHRFFSPPVVQQAVHEGCTTAGIGCIDCKKRLYEGLSADLARIRARADELRARPDRVDEILAGGAARARAVARETMARVRGRLGLPTATP